MKAFWGLRLTIVAALVMALALFAFINVYLFQHQATVAAESQEKSEAINSVRRVLMSLDFQIDQLDAVLGSWSNWTELYEHAAHPKKEFVEEELTEAALKQTRIDWFLRIDSAGHITDLVELPAADGVQARDLANADLAAINKGIAKLMNAPAQSGCGLLHVAERRALFCFRPLLSGDGTGPARGIVMVGRNFSADLLDQLSAQLGVDLSLSGAAPDTRSQSMDESLPSRLGAIEPYARLDEKEMIVEFPLKSYFDNNVGMMRLTLERTAVNQAKLSAHQTIVLLMFLIVMTGAVMIGVIDQLVVRRITQVKDDLRRIVDSTTWDGEISKQGPDEIGELGRYINSVIAVVRRQLVQMREISLTDALTKLPNRRHFEERYADAIQRHERSRDPMALALFDADYFKKYNDQYGHPAGDVALQTIAACLREHARRPGDLPARIGGEEFALLLEDTTLEGARQCAESVLQTMIRAGFKHQGNKASDVLTLSCGVAMKQAGETTGTLYRRADEALYRAKAEGRNRVCIAPLELIQSE